MPKAHWLFEVFTFLLLFFVGALMTSAHVNARDASGYEAIVMIGDGKRISEVDDEVLSRAYHAIKRKMFGGRARVIYGLAWYDFIGETVFSKTNRTQQAITFDFTVKETTYEKTAYTFGRSVSAKAKSEITKAIDAELGAKYDWTSKKETGYTKLETTSMNVTIAPGKRIMMRSIGTGSLSNGVSKTFFFWATTKKTTWELYEIKTISYEIVEEIA